MRNEYRLGDGPVLLLNPPGVVPCAHAAIATVILFQPREKERLVMLLHALSSSLPAPARLWLAGENKAGIKSCGRHLEHYFKQVSRLDSARHCGLFEACGPLRQTPFLLEDYQQAWQLEFAGHHSTIVSLPGVFAHGRLDAGSRLLLKTLERLQPRGRVLDFACGSGVIGIALLSAESDLDVTLLDASALALESAKRSLRANGLEASLVASDGLAGLNGKFDWVVSNPPFHRGIKNELDIAALFFRQAGTFLAEKGKIVIVCNQHLPYESWLRNHFEQVERLDANQGFVTLQASAPE